MSKVHMGMVSTKKMEAAEFEVMPAFTQATAVKNAGILKYACEEGGKYVVPPVKIFLRDLAMSRIQKVEGDLSWVLDLGHHGSFKIHAVVTDDGRRYDALNHGKYLRIK